MRIFITGCAKSGTTLLQRMFCAFLDTSVLPGEGYLQNFITRPKTTKHLVGKRDIHTIFSATNNGFISRQIELIKTYDIKILNIIRDGRDVLLSDKGYVSTERWIDCMQQRHQYGDLIAAEVRYEDLCRTPDLVQTYLCQQLGLKCNWWFSQYPQFVPESMLTDDSKDGVYKLRKVTGESIGKDLEAYKSICTKEQLEPFETELRKAGYDIRRTDTSA